MFNHAKKMKSYRDLIYAGISSDIFYADKGITEKLRNIPAIPLDPDWSLKPFISGNYISRFRICKGEKEVSVVLEWFNQFEENPYYEILPLVYAADYARFAIDEVDEIRDYIKNLFDNWENSFREVDDV